MQESGTVKERKMQDPPTSVPRATGTQQAGEATPRQARRLRWTWAEASIWTDRMLESLETEAKGGVWFRLIDKVYALKNLWSSWAKSAKNQGAPGVDGITIDRYEKDVEANLQRLSEQLRAGTYQPRPIRRTYIPKADGTMRPLGIPTVSDRIVQGAVRHVIEPIFEREFATHSYGFRPGRGCKDALRRVEELLGKGYRYVVDADLKSYFDTIPHDGLMQEVAKRVADGRVLKLIEAFLEARIMDDLAQWTPMAGAPQGAVLSPLLSNIYLNPLDHLMAAKGYEMVRYADDFVILCRSKQEAEAALAEVRQWTAQAGLKLHPEKTRLVHAATDGFEFLGYRFEKGRHWPREKSQKKLRETIAARTPRKSGVSLETTIDRINPVLRGWFGYFKHSPRWAMQKVDGWVRMRLRSILRKRQKRKGRGRGSDHQRWPNAFFARHGLFSLEQAHRMACQSLKRAH
jgi:RNA-directed DNA polymerase